MSQDYNQELIISSLNSYTIFQLDDILLELKDKQISLNNIKLYQLLILRLYDLELDLNLKEDLLEFILNKINKDNLIYTLELFLNNAFIINLNQEKQQRKYNRELYFNKLISYILFHKLQIMCNKICYLNEINYNIKNGLLI
jgi:hypothetical protein